MTYKVLYSLSSNNFIVSLLIHVKLSFHTSFMPPSLFLKPGILFLHLLHLTNSYLVFETQIKTHLLCEAFPVAPPSSGSQRLTASSSVLLWNVYPYLSIILLLLINVSVSLEEGVISYFFLIIFKNGSSRNVQ